MTDQPQLEDGYFRIVNALADGFAMARISQHQHQVIWAIIRKTYGWGKGKDRIAGSQLAELTGLTRQQCNNALIKLIEQKIVIREGSSRGVLKINTKTAEWVVAEKGTIGNVHTNNSNRSVNTNSVRSVNTICDHTKEQKDNIKSSYEDSSSGDDSAAAQIDLIQDEQPVPPAPQKQTKLKKAIPPVPHQEILDAYHEILPELPQVKLFSDDRKAALRARWIQHKKFQNVQWWRDLFEYVRTCDFLMGRKQPSQGHKVFMASFDFICQPKSFRKLVEGEYEN